MDILKLIKDSEDVLAKEFKKLDDLCFQNSIKVMKAFQDNQVSTSHFEGTSGYGYNDIGRDTIEQVFSSILDSEDSLVRSQFISGTHAISTALFGCLRPNDLLLSVSGLPYDTLHEVIGIKDNDSSLKAFGIKYDQIDLIDNDFDYDQISNYLKNNQVKVLYIQRSKGYSTRKTISIEQIEKLVKCVKKVDNSVIIMVDNCYCEFVSLKEPTKVGVDIMMGSLIKNLGGGIASNGGYIAGRKDLIHLCSERLNVAGEAKEVGPSLGMNKQLLQGVYFAPSVVNSALKIAVLTSYILEKLGYDVEPKYNDLRSDIVQSIIFNDKDKLIKYCQGIQLGSAIDSNALPVPSSMPGYEDDIIMASGSFIQGSSIEISSDGPIRNPYIAYQQGGLTYEYGKIALIKAIERIIKKG